MSMWLALVTLGDANIARILEDPPLVWRVIAPDDPSGYLEARGMAVRPGLLGRLFGRKAPSPPPVPDLVLGHGEGRAIDVDKAWHGIHYLLTRTAWEGEPPLNFVVAGGREVGKVDVGYGPARVLTAAEVKEVHAHLSALGDDELRRRFDPQDMTAQEIYPDIWTRAPEEDDTLGYLMEYLGILRGFLAQAAEDGVGVVLYLS